MKVLFVINQLFRGGAETALVNLLSAMPSEKYEIDLLIYDQIDLPDTVSLIPNIPSHVKIYNIAKKERKLAYLKKAFFKIYNKITHRTAFRKKAYKILKKNEYDIAFSFGEWFSPSLVAKYAKAKWKYVWIHADADKADFFHPDIHLYHECFDGFIFVSNNSRLAAEKQYDFLSNRSYIVNNMINEAEAREKSNLTPAAAIPEGKLPRLVTVANVRPEKNHLRQVRVMKKLFDKGIRFYWLNVGSQANSRLMEKITAEIQASGLEEYFLFTGAQENPYPIIKSADAVCVLSDHESWSMVITEAKAIGTPVIATKTSGALEQIVHKENGILCDFDDDDLADKIGEFLENPNIGAAIRENLTDFSSATDTLSQLDAIPQSGKKVLYVFDDVNYMSGARSATLLQAERLMGAANVTLFSVTAPHDKDLLSKYRVISIESNKTFKCLSVPTKAVLKSTEYSKRAKLLRIVYALVARLGLDWRFYQKLLKKDPRVRFYGFDAIIVVSEGSKLRHYVSKIHNAKKIQWIHTDYVAWRKHSNWTKKITSHDKKTYGRYDAIVCLSESLREKFAALYPTLSEKTVAIPNLIDYEKILRDGDKPLDMKVDKSKLNLITIGRMEIEKRYDEVLSLAKEIKDGGTDFAWYLVGDGSLYESLKTKSDEMGLSENVIFTAYLENVCPLLKQCDLFVLLSEYEGTPVTIDEAKVLGTPTLARNVGGIRDQLKNSAGLALDSLTASDVINFTRNSHSKPDENELLKYNEESIEKLKSILE